MGTYIKRPIAIQAFQYTGENLEDIRNVFQDLITSNLVIDPSQLTIWNKLEGCYVNCPINHWIIRGIKGEYYPVDPQVFAELYTEAPKTK